MPAVKDYYFTRHYATHSETWYVLAYRDDEVTPGWVRESSITFQDRTGQWYLLYHYFHHTARHAEADLVETRGMALESFHEVVL